MARNSAAKRQALAREEPRERRNSRHWLSRNSAEAPPSGEVADAIARRFDGGAYAGAGHAVQGLGEAFGRGDDDQAAAALKVADSGFDLRAHRAGRKLALGQVAAGVGQAQVVERALARRGVVERD